MGLLKKNSYLENNNYIYLFEFNIYFFLIILNFLTYSIYAVLSKYSIPLVEIIININFIIFFYFYKKNFHQKISLNFSFKKTEVFFFFGLLLFLITLSFSELMTPISGDEIAPTRRATRTAYFSSLIIIDILDINYLKIIPIKYIIQILNLIQIFFIIAIFYLLKKKTNILSLVLILSITFLLRLIIKDGVHHPPLNHIFSTTFISFFGLNHFVVRLAYLIPFWIFLVSLFKLIREHFDEILSKIFILSISTFPLLLLGSVSPDHSLWSCLVFTYLLFYCVLTKDIDYIFCIFIISIGILFRISIFTGFILIGLSFFADFLNKRFILKDKIIYLVRDQKVYLIFLIFIPLLLISSSGTPAFEGIENTNPINNLIEAIKSKIFINSLIKQIPFWYYILIFFIIFSKRKFEIICFFLFNLIIYFSVSSNLWGLAKYVLEYGVPFFLIGSFIFTKMLVDYKKKFLACLINIFIIFFNIYDYYTFPNSNISADLIDEKGIAAFGKYKDKNTKYILKTPYAYNDAFSYIISQNSQKNTLMFGTFYGFIPQIIQGYNYHDLTSAIKLKKEFSILAKDQNSVSKKIYELEKKKTLKEKITLYLNFMSPVEVVKSNNLDNIEISRKEEEINIFSNLNKIKDLRYVLIADYGNKKHIQEILLSNNWILDKKFIEKNYRSTLELYKKIE